MAVSKHVSLVEEHPSQSGLGCDAAIHSLYVFMHSLASVVLLVDVLVLATDAEVDVATDVLTVEVASEATEAEIATVPDAEAADVAEAEAALEMDETTGVDDELIVDTTTLLAETSTEEAAYVDAAASELAELLTRTKMEVALVVASADATVALSDADAAVVEADESLDPPAVKSIQSS